MKRILIFLVLLTFAISACAPIGSDDPVSPPDDGALDPAGSTMPMNENFAPSPADEGMTRGEVYLDDAELLTLESYPLQFMLNIKGSLPTPCHQLRVAVSPPDAENKVNMEVYSIADPDQICVQA